MKKIRIGNDFVFNWAIERGGLPEDLSSVLEKHLHLSVFGKRVELIEGVDYDITGNVIRIEVTPAIANIIGPYKVEFRYILPDIGFIDEDRKCAVDVDAFQIVARTAQADDPSEFTVTSDMAIAFKGDKGDSAYQVWIDAGNTGTEEDYFAYLRQPAIDAGASISELESEIQVNEGLRVQAESSRELAESLRVDAEILRQTNTQEAISNAENATENANTSAQNADDARLAIQDDLALKLGVDTIGIKKSYNLLDLKNVIQPGVWYASTGVHESTGTSGTRYVSTKPIPVKSNTTYYLSRKATVTSVPQSNAVAVFFDSNMVFIGRLLQSEYAPTKTITTPQDTAYMGLNIAYNAQTSYEEKRDILLQSDMILSEGADIMDFVPYGYYVDGLNTTDKYVYLSPTGDDLTADGSISNPFNTTSKAFENGFTKYLLLDGTYLSNNVAMPNGGELVAVNSGKAVVQGGSNQIIDDVTLHEGTIYKVPLTEAIWVNYKNFWIKDIPDATTMISESQRLPQDGNDTHRLKSTRLIRLASYADLQAFDGIATFSDSTMLYIKGIGGLVSALNPIIITKSTFTLNGKTLIKGVKFEYLGIKINNVTEMVDCSLMYASYSGITVGSNGGYGIFKNCRIGGVDNNGIGYDGSGDCQGREIGCYIHDCSDQGSSAHGTASVYRENSVYAFCNEGTADVGRVKIHFNGCVFLFNNRDIRFTFSDTPDNGNALIVNCSGNAPVGVMSDTQNNLLVMNSKFTGSMSPYAVVI